MNRYVLTLVFVLSVAATGCVTANTQASYSELNTQEGACAQTPGMLRYRACLRNGSPNTLNDDGTPMVLARISAGTLKLANPGSYQMTVIHDGKQLWEGMLDKDIPEAPSCADCDWVGFAIKMFPEMEKWPKGKYVIRFTPRYNVNEAKEVTITVGTAESS